VNNGKSDDLNWKQQFLLENYKQIHEHLRAVDRKRDTLLTIYVPGGSFIGILSYVVFSSNNWYNNWCKIKLPVIIGWLVISGIVFWIVTLYRRWHVEYGRIATAIHRSIMIEGMKKNNIDVYKTFAKLAKDPKKSKEVGFGPYIYVGGTEFWMAILVLVTQLFVFGMFWIASPKKILNSYLILGILVIVLFTGYLLFYYIYLSQREKRIQKNPQLALGWYLQKMETKSKDNKKINSSANEESMQDEKTVFLLFLVGGILTGIGIAFFLSIFWPGLTQKLLLALPAFIFLGAGIPLLILGFSSKKGKN